VRSVNRNAAHMETHTMPIAWMSLIDGSLGSSRWFIVDLAMKIGVEGLGSPPAPRRLFVLGRSSAPLGAFPVARGIVGRTSMMLERRRCTVNDIDVRKLLGEVLAMLALRRHSPFKLGEILS
jgi:hypothetical protein